MFTYRGTYRKSIHLNLSLLSESESEKELFKQGYKERIWYLQVLEKHSIQSKIKIPATSV